MKILIIGSGGREHTLAWKIAQSPLVNKIYCAPGNAGTKMVAENVPIEADNLKALLKFAKEQKIDLTLVGPEAPLVKGLVDLFEKEGLRVYGPSCAAAQLEGSKIFSKEKMQKYGVPTAAFKVFNNPQEAYDYCCSQSFPLVVKADGLAAGKGVVIAKDLEEVELAIHDMMVKKIFGEAGERILIEECLKGEEASILAFCDGKNVIPMVSSQDHKRIFDNDQGPNTGGMGAYSPAPVVTDEVMRFAEEKVLRPMVAGMAQDGIPYKGILYAGLMLTEKGPQVLEFNCRFGDPETQAVLPRLKSDLVPVLIAGCEGKLNEIELNWNEKATVCVVLASKGYPAAYEKGKQISGLEIARQFENVVIFHAGTKEENNKILTAGGRVLGVTAFGDTIKDAINLAYQAIEKISFDGMQYRKDIGKKATPF